MATSPLRWGICGTGYISNDFVNALSTLPPEDHKVQAVAARSKESAQAFADEHGISVYYAGYDELFADKDIDVIYIGTLNNTHEKLVIGALDAGKPVLCEKVMGINAKQTARVAQKAKEKGLFLMEAYWSRFFPAAIKLREELKAGVIGEAKFFNSNFGFGLADDPTKVSLQLGGGAVTSVGCYLPMMANFAFFANSEIEKPVKIVASGILNEAGSDTTAAVALHYTNNRLATFVCSIAMPLAHDAFITGEKGIIKIPDNFWSPTKLVTPTETHEFPLPFSDRKYNFPKSVGLRYEAEHVRQCLLKGYKESPYMTLKESVILAEINDEIRRQLGVKYPEDEQ